VPERSSRAEVVLVGRDDFCYDLRTAAFEDTSAAVRPAGVGTLLFARGLPSVALPTAPTDWGRTPFVDEKRIAELRAVSVPEFDLARLVRLLEELNACAHVGALFAVTALTRAVMDHVPPLFACTTFAQLASSYGGGSSFRQSLAHLEASARKIADRHLHAPVRAREVLPTPTQVNFSRDLDVLLEELVRRHRR
jgi:hypothetical protein